VPLLEGDIERIRSRALDRIAHVRRYQLGEHAEAAWQLLGELSAAFDTLTTPNRKEAYDRTLQGLVTRDGQVGTNTLAETVAPAAPPSPLPVAKPLAPLRPRSIVEAVAALPPQAPRASPTPTALLAITVLPTRATTSAPGRTRRSKRRSSHGVVVVSSIVLVIVAILGYLRPWSSGDASAARQPVQAARPTASAGKRRPDVSQPASPAAEHSQPKVATANPGTLPAWIPLFITPEELTGNATLKFVNGSWEIDTGSKINFARVAGDAILRAEVRKLACRNVTLKLRRVPNGYYSAWFNGGNWFGVGKWLSGKYVDIKHGRSKRRFDGQFEFKFAAIGDQLTVWADGEVVVQAVDRTYTEGAAGFGAANGRGLFRNLEIQILDSPLPTPAPP
jgi:hypothetical protein